MDYDPKVNENVEFKAHFHHCRSDKKFGSGIYCIYGILNI